MSSITSLTIEAADPAATTAICAALRVSERIGARAGGEPSVGFRGFSISLVVSQPGNVDALLNAAVEAGANVVKPAEKSLWGYGAAFQSPDGTSWTLASSAKKDSGPVSLDIEDIVLLLGVADVKASKQFYVERGFNATRSFGGKYAEFADTRGGLTLALNPRKLAAKNAGVSPDGSGSHRLLIGGDAGSFTDADGFVWEQAAQRVG
ncbi:glyoxalase [Occultella glacieicola]|uniref:Glyoxalase n=1 Tax=Occultella glacieicola TaxID=2518684 RepID=A0ABY2DYN8_9MICO|nr:glyoxalase [Occultella glacieicola]TDE89493.1 glyoxalase [Occultella glacieicola]